MVVIVLYYNFVFYYNRYALYRSRYKRDIEITLVFKIKRAENSIYSYILNRLFFLIFYKIISSASKVLLYLKKYLFLATEALYRYYLYFKYKISEIVLQSLESKIFYKKKSTSLHWRDRKTHVLYYRIIRYLNLFNIPKRRTTAGQRF